MQENTDLCSEKLDLLSRIDELEKKCKEAQQFMTYAQTHDSFPMDSNNQNLVILNDQTNYTNQTSNSKENQSTHAGTSHAPHPSGHDFPQSQK